MSFASKFLSSLLSGVQVQNFGSAYLLEVTRNTNSLRWGLTAHNFFVGLVVSPAKGIQHELS